MPATLHMRRVAASVSVCVRACVHWSCRCRGRRLARLYACAAVLTRGACGCRNPRNSGPTSPSRSTCTSCRAQRPRRLGKNCTTSPPRPSPRRAAPLPLLAPQMAAATRRRRGCRRPCPWRARRQTTRRTTVLSSPLTATQTTRTETRAAGVVVPGLRLQPPLLRPVPAPPNHCCDAWLRHHRRRLVPGLPRRRHQLLAPVTQVLARTQRPVRRRQPHPAHAAPRHRRCKRPHRLAPRRSGPPRAVGRPAQFRPPHRRCQTRSRWRLMRAQLLLTRPQPTWARHRCLPATEAGRCHRHQLTPAPTRLRHRM